MFNKTHKNLMRPSLITYSLLGGCLTLSLITPIQAKTPKTQTVAQSLGYPPGTYGEPDFISPYSQNSETYLVIVDSNDTGLFQRVRNVEPTAFLTRNPQGRSVIQAGTFKSLANAQERVRQLQSRNISSSVYTQSNGREVIGNNSGSTSDPYNRNNPRQKTKYYYVTIPEKPEKLAQISNQIRQSAGGNSIGIVVRNSPRGPHVAVGPFTGRLQAEQWNYYIRSLGISEARVYYGK